jgi:hypothetical protein
LLSGARSASGVWAEASPEQAKIASAAAALPSFRSRRFVNAFHILFGPFSRRKNL